MKKTLRILLLALLACALTALVGCGTVLVRPVTVLVAEGEGYTVAGENPRQVLPGESVTFQLELEEGWSLIGADGQIVEDGTVTVDRVLYPATIVPDVRDQVQYFDFQLCDPTVRGKLTSTAAPGEVIEGTSVTVTATPGEGYVFTGWTGEDKEDVRSTDTSYTFTMSADTVLYARYAREDDPAAMTDVALLVYNANGGTCTLEGAEDGIYYEEVSVSQFKLPNCMADLGQFVREGYHLVEYNTKPDGTGEGYSLGSKIILNTGLTKEDSAILYCIWKKETEASAFKYKEENGEIMITGYTGDHEELIIPAYIDGKPVTKINKNAFRDCAFAVLSIPTTMRTIVGNAFSNCENMVTMYFPDTVESVTDASFYNCSTSWKHFCLNAAMEPRYGPGMLTKVEAVITTQDQNRVVVLSGSSSLHGLDSDQLSEALDDQYYVVNHGTNAGVTATVYLEMYKNFLHEGDILVQAPEHSSEQLGSVAVSWKTYRELEMFYNVFRYLDASRYTFFAGYQEHQKTRLPMNPTTYNTHRRSYTEHGDIISSGKRTELNSPHYSSSFNIGYNTGTLNEKYAATLNELHGDLREAGVTVYVSFAPHNYNGLTRQARETSHKDAYTQYFKDVLDSTVISNLNDYTLEGQYIYDSDWHPNDFGREMRTEQLGKDIRAQLVKDGIFKE